MNGLGLQDTRSMMRTSNLLRWAQNNKNGNNNKSNNSNTKNWIHPHEALLHGHIAYLVKVRGTATSKLIGS
jgi:hypothetical protein